MTNVPSYGLKHFKRAVNFSGQPYGTNALVFNEIMDTMILVLTVCLQDDLITF
jgi:hypothetical protein